MIPVSSPELVIIDASVVVSVVTKEQATHADIENAIDKYIESGVDFVAPNVIIAEVIYALCKKLKNGDLTAAEHREALAAVRDLLENISLLDDEAGLMMRAVEIRGTYGCSRSSDSLYLALAESLANSNIVELFTLDAGMAKQAARNAPTVKVKVL